MSIGRRLLALVLVSVLLPSLVVGAYFYQTRTHDIEEARKDISTLTQLLGRGIEGSIRSAGQMAFALSKAQDVGSSDHIGCLALLNDVIGKFPEFTGLLKIQTDGLVECGSSASANAMNVADRDYFRAALSSTDIVVNPIRAGEITGLLILPVSYAVRDVKGAVKFVFVVTLNINQRADTLLQAIPYKNRILVLVDNKGVVIARRPKNNGEVGASIANTPIFNILRTTHAGSVQEQVDIDGIERIWAAVPVEPGDGTHLFLAVAVSKEEVLASADARLINASTILAITAVLAFVAALLVARFSIQQPARRIMAFAENLSAGNIAARISEPFPDGELGSLMKALNNTAASLESNFAELGMAREQLFQAQKVESIGQLTGGVAHDLNNILTVIIGNVDLIEDSVRVDPDLETSARLVRQAAERGVTLTKSLLAYSRKQPLAPRSTDLNELVKETDSLLRATLGENVDIVTLLGEQIEPAMIDPAYLPTALLNLALNARDAMPNGGKLTIETANAHLDEEYASRHSEVEPGAYVMVAVSDTGSGIPKEIQDKVFDPFFTTKAVGKGTGLGLSMVYGFVKQSRGHVKIYSEAGRGTTIKLYFPRAMSEAERIADHVSDNIMPIGRETVLIVEDDEMVRESVLNQIKSLGYTTVSATTGVEALAILSSRGNIDLLFTDVVLPGGMNGRRLAEEACRGRPNLKVLFTSGYTENAIIHHGRLDRDILLLTKPYSKGELARILRTALAGSQPKSQAH
jgi:signal transduction histidine kinase/CheY-like chemotaxis protein